MDNLLDDLNQYDNEDVLADSTARSFSPWVKKKIEPKLKKVREYKRVATLDCAKKYKDCKILAKKPVYAVKTTNVTPCRGLREKINKNDKDYLGFLFRHKEKVRDKQLKQALGVIKLSKLEKKVFFVESVFKNQVKPNRPTQLQKLQVKPRKTVKFSD